MVEHKILLNPPPSIKQAPIPILAVIVEQAEYIPTNEKATLSCVALTGLCMIGSVLSGVVGGVSECIVERKNHLMQERMGHTRD